MTEQSTESLVDELRGFAGGSESARATLMRDAADRLEAVAADSAEGQRQHGYWQQRAEKAEKALDTSSERSDAYVGLWRAVVNRCDKAERECDELAAVVEKVDDFVTRHYLDTRFGAEVLPILTAVPADVLRERDAGKWDEGADATAEYIENGGERELPNPYRQKREETKQ